MVKKADSSKNQITQSVTDSLQKSCDVKMAFASKHESTVVHAAEKIASTLGRGGRVLICGNGGSAADAQHMAGELLGRYKRNRQPLAAIALTTDTSTLTCIANDYGFEDVFSRQVEAIGRRGDVLVAITTSGNSPNVIKAMRAAKEIGLHIIALTGKGGGKAAKLSDILIDVPSTDTPRIQETHITAIHIICGLVESILFPED